MTVRQHSNMAIGMSGLGGGVITAALSFGLYYSDFLESKARLKSETAIEIALIEANRERDRLEMELERELRLQITESCREALDRMAEFCRQ